MPEEPKVWPVMLVASILILSIAAVMFVSAENEPSGPFGPMPPQYGQLTYSIGSEELEFNGSMVLNYSYGFGYVATNPVSHEGEIPSIFNFGLPLTVMGYSGFNLDVTTLDTAWGEKAVKRNVQEAGLKDCLGIAVVYSGVETSVTYRMDVIGKDFRLTCLLTETNFTEIYDMDPSMGDDRQVDVNRFPINTNQTYTVDQGGSVQSIWEPPQDKDLHLELDLTDYSFILMNESMMWTMLEGGHFIYDEQRSLVGNGTSEFTVEDGWFYWYLVQNFNGDGSGWIGASVVEE